MASSARVSQAAYAGETAAPPAAVYATTVPIAPIATQSFVLRFVFTFMIMPPGRVLNENDFHC
jgi:hypothetical protein